MTKKIFLIALTLTSYLLSCLAKTPPKLENSMDGDVLIPPQKVEDLYKLKRMPFPFTDIRMQKNQFTLEAKIESFITNELLKSNDTNATVQKFPFDTDLNLTITDKYANLLLIDEKGLNLFTYSYDLYLSKCGATAFNIKQVSRVYKKADIFKLNSMPLKNYRIIVQTLLMEAIKNSDIDYQQQEMAFFVNIHPSLTFLPAAVIEDTLEDLRMNFEQFNIRYCTDCDEIVPYDEYGYLTWYSSSGRHSEMFKDDFSDENLITMGINEKAIFVAYPLALADKNLDSDKLNHHTFCNKNHTFVQNAYYERGLEQFTDDIIVYYLKNELKKKEYSQTENIIYFPCFPENYWELMSNIEVYGSGDYSECKKLIAEYIKVKSSEKIASEFGFEYSLTWPLQNLNSGTLKKATVVLESEVIKQMLAGDMDMKEEKKLNEIITGRELDKEIEKLCKTMFENNKAQTSSNSVKNLSKCIHLVYTRELLKKTHFDDDKDILLKLKNNDWIRGLVYENLITFHNKENEWFHQAQQYALESYFFGIQQKVERDRTDVIFKSWGLMCSLFVTFAIGFIVRYRAKEPPSRRD